MKIKNSVLLIVAAIITSLSGEEFIDTLKELNVFTPQYDFGAPVKKAPAEVSVENENNLSIKESNISLEVVEKPEELPREKLKRELNIKCGGKCGIDFKSFPAK